MIVFEYLIHKNEHVTFQYLSLSLPAFPQLFILRFEGKQ